MVSTPSAPDPAKTAAAQSATNRDTAITQQQVNMVDQVNPWGSVTYSQTGTNKFKDSNGNWVETPQYTQTTTLSPEQQAIFEQSQAAQTNLAGIAADQSAFLQDYLNKPFEFSNSDAEQWAYDLASPRILQQQQQNEDALRASLANKGIQEGSAAWNAEMQRLTNANTDQLNQLALTGRQQAFNEALTTRNQPINEISALLSGSQIANPATQSSSTPTASVGGVDYAGLVNSNYNSQLSQSNAAMGGLFGLAGTLGGAAIMSDARLKVGVVPVGRTPVDGIPLYAYRYVWGGPVHIGVMAQEALHAAVMMDNGYLAVDYSRVH